MSSDSIDFWEEKFSEEEEFSRLPRRKKLDPEERRRGRKSRNSAREKRREQNRRENSPDIADF